MSKITLIKPMGIVLVSKKEPVWNPWWVCYLFTFPSPSPLFTFCSSAVCLHFSGTAYGVTDFEYAKTSEVRENYMDNDLDKIDREPGFQLWFHEKELFYFWK